MDYIVYVYSSLFDPLTVYAMNTKAALPLGQPNQLKYSTDSFGLVRDA